MELRSGATPRLTVIVLAATTLGATLFSSTPPPAPATETAAHLHTRTGDVQAAWPAFQEASAHRGARSPSVRRLQKRLARNTNPRIKLPTVHITGRYSAVTIRKVKALQRSLGHRGAIVDGIVGPVTAQALKLRWVPAAVPMFTVPAGGALTPTGLKAVLVGAGFREPALRTAWAIVMRESRAIPTAVSPKNANGTRDRGLFQINDVHAAWADTSRLLDPAVNAATAYTLSKKGTDFGAWAVGDTGWAGQLKKSHREMWQKYNDQIVYWSAKYPG